jgi:hypothetical protein
MALGHYKGGCEKKEGCKDSSHNVCKIRFRFVENEENAFLVWAAGISCENRLRACLQPWHWYDILKNDDVEGSGLPPYELLKK